MGVRSCVHRLGWAVCVLPITGAWMTFRVKFSLRRCNAKRLSRSAGYTTIKRQKLRCLNKITARTNPSSTHERCIVCACRELLGQIAGASSYVTLNVCIKEKHLDRQWP